jgi:hypothetical protein
MRGLTHHVSRIQKFRMDSSQPIPEGSPPNSWQKAGLLVAFGVGLSACLLGGASAACGLSLALINRRQLVPATTLPIISLLVIGVCLGLPLAWQAIAALSGRPSKRLASPLAWGAGLAGLYLVALAGGQTVLSLNLAPAVTLPPFHILALAIPALLCLWGAVRLAKEPQFTWRRLWGALSGGAFGAVGLAFVIELVLLVLGIVAVAIVMGGSPDWIQQLGQSQLTSGGLADSPLVRSLFRNPIVIFTLFASFSFVVPLVEETAKSIVPALAGAWHGRSARQIFLWGVAGGAGFAVVEGLLNGSLSADSWASVALLRIGASAMHCLTAGLTGWGWGEVWTQRRWPRLLLAYVVAVAIHGVWNGASIGIAVAGVAFGPGTSQNTLVIGAVGLLILLTVGEIIALMAIAQRTGRSNQAV